MYARGLRNPQGLLVARDGRIWESEHGPRGGDEVNLIRRGGNYGWPIVTYGTEYSGAPWRYNPEPGEHAGFAIPRFAFLASIGISELMQPDANAFPDWRNHILAASLIGNALYALKTEGDDITYAEQIPLGERLRDLISLADGRIAIVTDSGQLMLLRNGAQHEDSASSFVVSGLANRPQLLPEEAMPDTPEMAGAVVFFYNCGTCHSTSGYTTLIGPPLNGMFGREIGSIDDYTYSPALANASGRWTPSRLRAFLNHEDRQLEGAAMPAVPLLRKDFNALVRYLRSMEDMPEEQ
ncbi:MAG: PQQ-dependent sugar dehydrogenase [Terricaulis sp.]|nr:PQQ-dependent sugar dehydrogenase [Terricaulis sp.]